MRCNFAKFLAIFWLIAGCSRPKQFIINDWPDREHKRRIAIGYLYDRTLTVVTLDDGHQMREIAVAGPGFYAGSLGPHDTLYGTSRKDETEFLALRDSGELMWSRHGLFAEDNPAVSADGEKVAFTGRDDQTHESGVLLVENKGKTVTAISREGNDPSWSPDGLKLSYQQDGDILIYDLRTKLSEKIARGSSARWSPTLPSITFKSDDGNFWLVDVHGTPQRKLFSATGILTPLYWSPDSEYLMYVQKGSRLRGIVCSDDSISIIVFRVRDGSQIKLMELCNSIPYESLRWLEIPASPFLLTNMGDPKK